MAQRIEDYALIGDCYTAALVGRNGSIDWLCLPRFDSGACFAALLGGPEHGRWLLAPQGDAQRVARRYRDDTLVLETDFETAEGAVRVTDCMSIGSDEPTLIRTVEGLQGTVPMRGELVIRFDYGASVPWVRSVEGGITAVAGPDSVLVHSDVPLRGENLTTCSDFTVSAGQKFRFVMMWHPFQAPLPQKIDADESVRATEKWWREWSARCTYRGPWREQVLRSLIVLKALTYAPTGGIVAAVTTSLPEKIGGVRNWDYRYCWVRDATFTLDALMSGGYVDEACAWREWLLRAVAGTPDQLNIMYGVGGERRLTELELDWLPGYENARPVRIGNAAHTQFQLDVFGEVMDAMDLAFRTGVAPEDDAWGLQRAMLKHLESVWQEPDEGIWEVRGPRRHFTHSKVMAWTAFDRGVKAAERCGDQENAARWGDIRDAIHREVCRLGYDPKRNSFVQYYGAEELDASLLMLPLVGFLPPSDRRIRGTVEAIQRELMFDGFVLRYPTTKAVDGLPPGEAAFLACTFWLADCLAVIGCPEEARQVYQRLLDLRNDVGLLAEEYDPVAKRFLGNFPQAFSHVGLINTACNLSRTGGEERRSRCPETA